MPPTTGPTARPLLAAERGSRAWSFWVVLLVLCGVWLMASSPACPPWDPWETHYGEVARNIVARADPIDLWWKPGYGPDGSRETVFWTKHAGPFWAMAAGLSIFGVGASTDPTEMVTGPWPELGLRLPGVVALLLALLVMGTAVERLVSRRAAVLSVLAVVTMPQLAVISRQALTDIYMVAPLCLGVTAWGMAWLQEDRDLHQRGAGWTKRCHDRAWWVFFAALAVAAILPLLVMHIHVVAPWTAARVARMKQRADGPSLAALRHIAQVLWVYWAMIAAIVVISLKWRRRSQVWMGLVYLAAGLAFMGKGLLGPALMGLVLLLHLVVTGSLSRLRQLGLGIGLLIFIVSCVPWHHAMWIYRGDGWFRELIVINNLARFSSGEQSQAIGGPTYYLSTLGLAAFPWIAVLPLVFVSAARSLLSTTQRTPGPVQSREAWQTLVLIWAVTTFAVLSYSTTKYYHYLAPCLAPLGLLIGLWLDEVFEDGIATASRAGIGATPDEQSPTKLQASQASGPDTGTRVIAVLLGACAVVLVLRQALREPAWQAHLTSYLYTGMWKQGVEPQWSLVPCGALMLVGLLLWVWRRARAAVTVICVSAMLATTVVLNVFLPAASHEWSQRDAFELIAKERGEHDVLVSWWLYHRGETWFSKAQVWVTMEPNKTKVAELVDKHRGKGATFWIMTTPQHAKSAAAEFPPDVAATLQERWSNHHYALLVAQVP